MDRFLAALEATLFRARAVWILLFVALTAWMAWNAAHTRIDASFNKQLPLRHPYIQTFTKHQEQFGGANRILVALMARQGDIFTPAFFDALKGATDEVFFLPGVDRSQVQSLFTPNVRYIEVVEDGFTGGTVIPADFRPTPDGFARVRDNILKSGKLGQLVANDFTGAVVSAQLLEFDPVTGRKLDYAQIAALIESRVREKFSSAAVGVHIIGFAQVIGDVSAGARGVVVFFGVSFAVTALLVWLYAHAWRFAAPTLVCSFVAVIWQLGFLRLLGYGLDPFSMLVPFLVFAIGVSHAVQMIRAFREEVFLGKDSLAAARAAFRQLLVPGGVALLTDTVGFLTMLVIDIQAIRELAVAASLGVAMIVFTHLFLLPVILSYLKVPDRFRAALARRHEKTDRLWAKFSGLMAPKPSIVILLACAALGFFAVHKSKQVRIGDLHAGVPELHPDSRYNTDSRLISEKFNIGVDVLSVIVETGPNGCIDPDVVRAMDELESVLRDLPAVRSVVSVTTVAKMVNSAWNEGSLKWRALPRDPRALAQAVAPIETSTGLLNADASVMPVLVFLTDHKAESLTAVTDAVRAFAATHDSPKAAFKLAGGNAGIMAATNEVVDDAQFPILLWVFGAVIALCLLTFRSWRATVAIVAPLALVSWLAYVVMVYLEIGLKTSSLPVVALGVGIGVDYGIYLFARLLDRLRRGDYFEDALHSAFTQTGNAIVFTGLALAIGTGTWIFSDLKFQADMGVLLTFMFLVNMLAAIVLLPAIARWFYRHHCRNGR